MTKAFVLMTALPPTYGHLDLIQFAASLNVEGVTVLLNTQPDEPLVSERYYSLAFAVKNLSGAPVTITHQNEFVQQEAYGPDDQDFWDDWVYNLHRFGFQDGDIIVASEPYGVRLAQEAGGRFMVYDRDRWVRFTKGTHVRNDHIGGWDQMLPEFRTNIQKRVTIFGAESTGKTTLTVTLTDEYNQSGVGATKLFEWARPFLEMTHPEVTHQDMFDIWEGQQALQECTYKNALHPLVIQDTDLWTTIGFWEDWDPNSVPADIYPSARGTQSDLYLITKSNIPFEPDPLRTGGDHRETADEYWINLCEKYKLPYKVLEENSLADRIGEAMSYIDPLLTNPLTYQRIGAEYATS